ncbi:MAG: hypothetical protein ACXWZ2_12755 [Mycobacterium sp.]
MRRLRDDIRYCSISGFGQTDQGECGPSLRATPEVYDWGQVRESMVLTLPHPTLGDLDVPGSPLRLSEHTEPRREAPPALGVDQDDVFADYVRAGGCR